MSKQVGFLGRYVNWEKIPTEWLHLIWTPDTKELMKSVKEQIQTLLDLHHNNTESPSVREIISSEIITDYKQFACGESISTLEKSVRWKHVYLFSDPSWDYQPIEKKVYTELKKWIKNLDWWEDLLQLYGESFLNNKFIHDLFLLSAIKTHWAKTTNSVQACIPYARQDDMTPKKRQPASLELIWKSISDITWKDGYCMTIDIHNHSAARGVFSKTNFINYYTWWFVKECIKDIWNEDVILSWADQWWDKKISAIAKELKKKNIIVVKSRDYAKDWDIEDINVYWNIEWKNVLIHDDMLDTWWTMCTLLREMLKKEPKSVNIAVTHGMFNWKAIEKLEEVIKESNWIIQKVYVTNSINKEELPSFIKVINWTNLFANNILNIFKWLWLDRNDNNDYKKEVINKKKKSKGKKKI